MHTPADFVIVDVQAHVKSWLQVIFNPSFTFRLARMLIASGLTVALLLAGISAYRWLKADRGDDVLATFKTGIYLAAFLISIQIGVGDMHGVNMLHHQPAKIAAMQGIREAQCGASAVLFALPDASTQSNRYEIAVPKLASFYLTHDWNGELQGIKAFSDKHPGNPPLLQWSQKKKRYAAMANRCFGVNPLKAILWRSWL